MDAMVSREDFTVAILINKFNLHVHSKSLTLYPQISMPFPIIKPLINEDRHDHRNPQLVKIQRILGFLSPWYLCNRTSISKVGEQSGREGMKDKIRKPGHLLSEWFLYMTGSNIQEILTLWLSKQDLRPTQWQYWLTFQCGQN